MQKVRKAPRYKVVRSNISIVAVTRVDEDVLSICSKKMSNFGDSIVTRYCKNNNAVLMASQNLSLIRKLSPRDIKDVEVVKPPRYNILQTLSSACPKPAPCNIILLMDDGLYLVSQTNHTDKSLKWKPISKLDKNLYNEVMRNIKFESSMSSLGLGTTETPMPSHIRELCLQRFRYNMCDVGVSAKPDTNSCSIQTKVKTHDTSTQLIIERKSVSVNAVVETKDRAILAVRETASTGTATYDVAGGDVNQGNTDEKLGHSDELQNMIISINIRKKSPKFNVNVASLKIKRKEAFAKRDREGEDETESFRISDEDFSTILQILNKAKNNLSKNPPSDDQAQQTNFTADVPVENSVEDHKTNTEEYRTCGAIPKRLKTKNYKNVMDPKVPTLSVHPVAKPVERITISEITEDKFETARNQLQTEYHLDPPFQLKPGLTLYSPFQTFGYNDSNNIPLSLARVKIPVVEKKHMVLNVDGKGLNEIGSGNNGRVYIARHILRTSLVCVKEFNIQRYDRFEVFMEAKVFLYLKSTGYVPECHGLMESPSNPNHLALVQEYFGGGVTLKKVLLECPNVFSYKQWINVCFQMLLGLHKIHSFHVIINDIKCDNILVDITGEMNDCVRFIDFGCATFRQGFSYPWSPEYMKQFRHIAPEVRNGRATTPASDLYSLGCVLRAIYKYAGIISMDPIAGSCMRSDPYQRPATLDVMERV